MRAKEFVASKTNVHPTKKSEVPDYMLGSEVEHTAAFGKTTLFVNFPSDVEEIKQAAEEFGCEHIYLELSRVLKNTDNPSLITKYHKLATELLNDYWVTVDCPNTFAERFADLTDNKKFVINMAVLVPGIEKLKNNVSVKLTAGDFKNSAGGVYCLDLNKIRQDKNLTKWKDYNSDKRVDVK
jgi:hypothetical protein